MPGGDRGDNTARCKCRNLADEHMPPSERIGDAEARRLGLWSDVDCPQHAPTPDPRPAFAAAVTDGVRHALLKERLEALAEELGDRQVKAIVKASQFPEGAERYYRELGRAAGFGVAQRLLRTALDGEG